MTLARAANPWLARMRVCSTERTLHGMKRNPRLHPVLATAGAMTATIAALSLGAVAHARPDEPHVPDTIQVEEGNKVFLVGHAVGVQIYSCTDGASGPRWTFGGPRADVYGENGELAMTHFGGPTWLARDGSKVVGSRVDGVTVDPTAIPWLLLSAAPSSGPDGERLSPTTFIQRVNTTGGLEPPASECNASTAGTTEEVDYTADYYFWKATGR